MAYKVFLVEDEIVAREGMRDTVNWEASGFQLCGEASDGEMALALLETARPDVLITDIRMPFMDGLQLSKIVRDRMPGTKIVILSGHDEFEYAQAAVKLGVTEYLLKPLGAQDLHAVLRRLAVQLEQDQRERADLHQLRSQVAQSHAALRESLLLRLVMGTAAPAEVFEQGQAIGLDLIARWYMVGLVQVQVAGGTPVSAAQSERVQRLAAGLLADTSGVFLLRKHPGELVLIFKGQEPQQLREEAEYLVAALVRQAEEAHCALRVGLGAAKPHLRELYHSLVEALSAIQTERGSGRSVEEGAVARRASLAERPDAGLRGEPDGAGTASSELLKVDQLAVSNFLRYGVKEEVDEFLAALIRPLSPAARRSLLIKNYLLMDIVVAAAQFVHELGGDVEVVAPDLRVVEELQTFIQSLEDILPPARSILLAALAFRDSHLNEPYAAMMRQVKQYLATHYGDPGLSLQEVARAINLSPSHFSMVFGQEAGTTFRSYLTDIRIGKARELLRATALRPSEIAVQVGYSDPHYFSFVFRKRIGRTPTEFRSQALGG